MSDDFDNDSFLVDDSFLREVDNLTAKAAIQPRHPVKTAQSGSTRAAALHVSASSRGWTGPQRNNSSGPSSHSFLKTAPSRSQCTVRPSSSDDYDELSFPAESFAAFDSLQSRPQVVKPIASSRFARTSSGHDVFLQTHLNFRREKQSTKGKRWDRTAFAESGRRIGTDKKQGKSKGKGKRGTGGSDDDDDQDEEEEEEDNCGDALAPYPKPSIDPSELGLHSTHLARGGLTWLIVGRCTL